MIAGFGAKGNASQIGANGNGFKIGSSGNLQVMGSMAFGLGTSAVGSPGFGQFLGPGPNSSSLVSSAVMNPQLGGDQTLFSRQEAISSGGNQHPGSYHPFGSSRGLNVGLQNTGLNQGVQPAMHTSPLHRISGHSVLLIVAHLTLFAPVAMLLHFMPPLLVPSWEVSLVWNSRSFRSCPHISSN